MKGGVFAIWTAHLKKTPRNALQLHVVFRRFQPAGLADNYLIASLLHGAPPRSFVRVSAWHLERGEKAGIGLASVGANSPLLSIEDVLLASLTLPGGRRQGGRGRLGGRKQHQRGNILTSPSLPPLPVSPPTEMPKIVA